jgi:hypothetical protein
MYASETLAVLFKVPIHRALSSCQSPQPSPKAGSRDTNLLPKRSHFKMELFEILKTVGLWCIALTCVVNGLMLDLALGKVLALMIQIVRDFVR